MPKVCVHFVSLKNQIVKCAIRRAIRSWNCKQLNKYARCWYYTEVETPSFNNQQFKVNLCQMCIYATETEAYGVRVYFCKKKQTRQYGRVGKCLYFATVEAPKSKTLLDFFVSK